ncbi:MAG: type II toxin-antitoxin system VapC family toxin [Caulobacter sp.]
MKFLIDTHVLIWWLTDVDQLSRTAFDLLDDPANTVLVSAVSGYEIELKRPIDSLLQKIPLDLEVALGDEGFEWLAPSAGDMITAGRLPRHHRDPWDRILIAQGLNAYLPIVTADTIFPADDAVVLW